MARVTPRARHSVHVVTRTRWRDNANVARVSTTLRDIVRKEGVDLIHANESSSLMYATLAGRLAKVPVIWHVHDPLRAARTNRRVRGKGLAQVRPAWIVYANSPRIELRTSLSLDPLFVILPGIDHELCRSGDADHPARKELGVSPGAPVISTFGRLHPFKCQRQFIRTIAAVSKLFPDVQGVICGPGQHRRLPQNPHEPSFATWPRRYGDLHEFYRSTRRRHISCFRYRRTARQGQGLGSQSRRQWQPVKQWSQQVPMGQRP